MKKYNSFQEINRDLKFLELKSKIELEEIKYTVVDTKDEVARALSPMNLLSNTIAIFTRKALYVRVVDKLVTNRPLLNALKRFF